MEKTVMTTTTMEPDILPPPTDLSQTAQSQTTPSQPQTTELAVETRAPAIIIAPKASPEVHTAPTPLLNLRDEPAWIDCPFCYARAKTRVAKGNTDSTCVAATLCCLCCGVLCMWIPFAFHWYADIEHFCTSCSQRVVYIPHEGGSAPLKVQVFGPGLAGSELQGAGGDGKRGVSGGGGPGVEKNINMAEQGLPSVYK